jgi:hypothetical protein
MTCMHSHGVVGGRHSVDRGVGLGQAKGNRNSVILYNNFEAWVMHIVNAQLASSHILVLLDFRSFGN